MIENCKNIKRVITFIILIVALNQLTMIFQFLWTNFFSYPKELNVFDILSNNYVNYENDGIEVNI